MSSNDNSGAVVLGIILAIASTILLARFLFPFFLVVSLLLLLALIGFFIFETSSGGDMSISPYIGIAFLIAIVGTGASWFIGYGIGGTPIGQATLEVYDALNLVEDELQQAMDDFVEISCEQLDERNCKLLRDYSKTAKTLNELKDYAETLEKAGKVVDKITE
jgi:FtsZ-binding cell division protein ZapB